MAEKENNLPSIESLAKSPHIIPWQSIRKSAMKKEWALFIGLLTVFMSALLGMVFGWFFV